MKWNWKVQPWKTDILEQWRWRWWVLGRQGHYVVWHHDRSWAVCWSCEWENTKLRHRPQSPCGQYSFSSVIDFLGDSHCRILTESSHRHCYKLLHRMCSSTVWGCSLSHSRLQSRTWSLVLLLVPAGDFVKKRSVVQLIDKLSPEQLHI